MGKCVQPFDWYCIYKAIFPQKTNILQGQMEAFKCILWVRKLQSKVEKEIYKFMKKAVFNWFDF